MAMILSPPNYNAAPADDELLKKPRPSPAVTQPAAPPNPNAAFLPPPSAPAPTPIAPPAAAAPSPAPLPAIAGPASRLTPPGSVVGNAPTTAPPVQYAGFTAQDIVDRSRAFRTQGFDEETGRFVLAHHQLTAGRTDPVAHGAQQDAADINQRVAVSQAITADPARVVQPGTVTAGNVAGVAGGGGFRLKPPNYVRPATTPGLGGEAPNDPSNPTLTAGQAADFRAETAARQMDPAAAQAKMLAADAAGLTPAQEATKAQAEKFAAANAGTYQKQNDAHAQQLTDISLANATAATNNRLTPPGRTADPAARAAVLEQQKLGTYAGQVQARQANDLRTAAVNAPVKANQAKLQNTADIAAAKNQSAQEVAKINQGKNDNVDRVMQDQVKGLEAQRITLSRVPAAIVTKDVLGAISTTPNPGYEAAQRRLQEIEGQLTKVYGDRRTRLQPPGAAPAAAASGGGTPPPGAALRRFNAQTGQYEYADARGIPLQ